MSKIKIKQVDSLEEEAQQIYSNLNTSDCFVFKRGGKNDSRLVIKTQDGHMWLDRLVQYTGDEHPNNMREVVLVDAEIRWAHRGGGE